MKREGFRDAFVRFLAIRGGSIGYLLSRVAIDAVMINVAFVLGFVAWVAIYVSTGGTLADPDVIPFIQEHYLNNVGMFNLVTLTTFILSGLYVRLPTYSLRRRLLAVARAVGLAFIVHTALIYLLLRQQTLAPRASAIFGFLFAMVLVALPRIAKSMFFRRYTIVPKRGSLDRPVEHVLVVGGAGYIGSVLVRLLLQAGKRVRVLDNLMFGDAAIRELQKEGNFELMVGDFRNVENVVRAVRGVDAVVHLGAIVGDPACSIDDEVTLEVNYAATGLLCEVCKGAGIKRFVFASTCSVYGASDGILDEHSALNPVSLYATSKIDSESGILRYADADFRPTVLRLATAFGFSFRPRFDLVVNLLAAQAVAKHKIKIMNGNQWRPFVHIYDISRAMQMCLEAPLATVGGEVFNVGDESQNCTLEDLGAKVAAIVPGTEVERVNNDSDPRNYRVSFDKIRSMLAFRCSVRLEDGISEVAEAVRSGAVGDFSDPIYSNVAYFRAHEGLLHKSDVDSHMDATAAFLKKRLSILTGAGVVAPAK